MEKKITVRWKRSTIGRREDQKKIMRALGFRRLNQILALPDRPEIRGMLRHVSHLIDVIE